MFTFLLFFSKNRDSNILFCVMQDKLATKILLFNAHIVQKVELSGHIIKKAVLIK